MNIAKIMENSRELFPDKTALIFGEKSFTYRELDEMSTRIAAGLSGMGFCAGDRIALFLPNIPEFVTAYFAIHKLGAVAVLINPGFKPGESSFILNDSRASAVLTTELLISRISENSQLPHLRHIFIVSDSGTGSKPVLHRNSGTGETMRDCIALTDLMSGASRFFQTAVMGEDDPCAILYTSGTTGFPKGAVLSHKNVVSNVRTGTSAMRVHADASVLLFLPLFHNFALNSGLASCFDAGATLVLQREFEPEAAICAAAEYKITHLYGSPSVYMIVYDKALVSQMQSAKNCICAGAVLPLEISEKWEKKFGVVINQMYGLTECSIVSLNSFDPSPKYRHGSVGRPVDGVEMKILDKDGNEAKTGERGEVAVKGTNVMSGYWGRSAETAEVIRKGWFHTGDIGRKDEDGYFYIVDRKKDMVNVDGKNVYPSEVENVLLQHPAVAEAAVYGLPDPVMGERVHASIVLKSGQKPCAGELTAFCRERLADFKIPVAPEFADSLPKAKSGKILKRVLREHAAEKKNLTQSGISGTGTAPLSQEQIKKWIADWLIQTLELNPPEFQTDRPFAEYGLTSILTVSMMVDLNDRSGRFADPVLPWHYPTADRLSAHLTDLWNKPCDPDFSQIQRLARNRDFPLSFAQEEIWFYHQHSPDAGRVWSVPVRYRIIGRLDTAILAYSLNDLIRRQEILRTGFPAKNNVPVQKIAPELTVTLQVSDLSSMPEPEKTAEAERLMEKETQQPLDIAEGPLWRVKLIRMNETSHILLVYIHHLIMDAWSMEIFGRELFSIYGALRKGRISPLPELSVLYADFALWQREFFTQDKLEKRLAYYRDLLTPEPLPMQFPFGKPRTSAKTGPGGIENFQISRELTQKLESLSQGKGATLFMTVFAAFAALLHRCTGCEDIVMGVPMSRRYWKGTDPLIGYFSGQGIIRVDTGGNPAFAKLLERTKMAVQSAMNNQDLTLGQVLNALHRDNHDAFMYHLPYRVGLDFLPVSEDELKTADISVTQIREIKSDMVLDMVLFIWKETDAAGSFLKGHFSYRSDLFEGRTIAQMTENFRTLLEAVAADPEVPIRSAEISV